jgi:hypothetical protein
MTTINKKFTCTGDEGRSEIPITQSSATIMIDFWGYVWGA